MDKLLKLLKKHYKHDYDSGKLICIRQWPYTLYNENKAVGGLRPDGYLGLTINNKDYLVHRLIWLLVYGSWPKDQIDHRDGNRSNNKLSNLRDVTNIINAQNAKMSSNNISGYTGVSWLKRDAKWYASIMVEGKTISLGQFHNKELAIKARKEAEVKYGFTARHGTLD